MRDVQEILSELEKLGVKDRKIREYIGLKDRQTIGRWWNGQRPIHKNLFKLKRLLEIAQKYQTYDLPTFDEAWDSSWEWWESDMNELEKKRVFAIRHELCSKIDQTNGLFPDWANELVILTPRVAVELVAKWHPNWNTRKKFSEILVLL